MKMVNEIIRLPEEKVGEKGETTIYKEFERTMTDIFTKVEDENWMNTPKE